MGPRMNRLIIHAGLVKRSEFFFFFAGFLPLASNVKMSFVYMVSICWMQWSSCMAVNDSIRCLCAVVSESMVPWVYGGS